MSLYQGGGRVEQATVEEKSVQPADIQQDCEQDGQAEAQRAAHRQVSHREELLRGE